MLNNFHLKSKGKVLPANQKATALLMAVLLAGAISLIAFGMTKIALNESFAGTKSEEGLEAYYAAQAGIEDALMRFKFHNDGQLEVPKGATKDSSFVVRVYINRDLSDSDKVARIPGDTPVDLNKDDFVYDLKVWHKMICPSTADNSDDLCQYDLAKDSSILLDVSEVSNFNLFWQVIRKNGNPAPPPTGGEASQTGLWYRLTDPILPFDSKEFYTCYFPRSPGVRNPEAGGEPCSPIAMGSIGGNIQTRGFRLFKLKAFLPSAYGNVPSDNLRIRVKITGTNEDDQIGQPKVHIESTGYYGGTAKKIEVIADRETKSILDVFDYVIYAGRNELP